MINNPLISIITPTYNHACYIGRCIDSLLAQTYSNWEMVIIDDGSTDNTAEVVKSYRDPRITYLYQKNRGVKELAGTINTGLSKTKGEFVTMLGSDDTWPSYRLEKQIPVFEDPNVVLCFGYGYLIDENDNILGSVSRPSDLKKVENRPVGSALHDLFLSHFIFQPSVLLRRSALEKIGGYLQPEGLLAEDYPTHMTLALEGEFRYLDLPLANYRMHPGQMTRNHYAGMVETDIPYVLEFFRRLSPEMKQRSGWTEASLKRALSNRLNNSYFEVGRRDLLAGNWTEARRHFVKALRCGSLTTKAKALLGICCSALHTDMEKIIRLSGHTPLR
jgi:glycosyltransferase involved in cell wall biosynthesis